MDDALGLLRAQYNLTLHKGAIFTHSKAAQTNGLLSIASLCAVKELDACVRPR